MREPEEGGFLGRWAARKARARRQERAEPEREASAGAEPATPTPASASAPQVQVEAESEEELLARLGLPAPEALQPGDDFAAFMKAAIPQAIRRRALRRLWAINPDLANLDGLLDYGEDFTDGANVVEGMTTAWEAGKGYARKVLSGEEGIEKRAEAEEPAAPLEQPGEPAGDAGTGEPSAPSAQTDMRPEEAAGEADEAGDGDIYHQEQDLVPAPRRMRFRFEQSA